MATLCPSQNKALPGKPGARMSRRWASYKCLWQNDHAMALNQKAAKPGSSSIVRQSCRKGGLLLSPIKYHGRRNGEQVPSHFNYMLTSRSAVPLYPGGTHTRTVQLIGGSGVSCSGLCLHAAFSCIPLRPSASPVRALGGSTGGKERGTGGWGEGREERSGGSS